MLSSFRKHGSFIFQTAGWFTEFNFLNSRDQYLIFELECLNGHSKPADAISDFFAFPLIEIKS